MKLKNKFNKLKSSNGSLLAKEVILTKVAWLISLAWYTKTLIYRGTIKPLC
jgi:hypothetical protein